MSTQSQVSRQPKLRFPEFHGDWQAGTISQFLQRVSNPVDVKDDEQYRQIGVRSHGKGLFHKDPVSGAELGEKRVFWVEPHTLVLNIVFAWEQALAITTKSEEGFVASHRFPMFSAVEGQAYIPFMLHFFMRKRGKSLLALASPGGAGRNKTLGQSEFTKLDVILPKSDEQKRVADFLDTIDSKIFALGRKSALLNDYKRGVIEQIFSRTSRFKKGDGSDFPDWVPSKLGDIATFSKGKGIAKSDIVEGGDTPCIRYGELYTEYREVIGKIKSRTNEPKANLILSEPNDVIIPASGEAALDIACAACVMEGGVALGGDINILRGKFNGVFLAYYLNNVKRLEIARLAQGNSVVHLYSSQLKNLSVLLPDEKEQEIIADFLAAIDLKIQFVLNQMDEMTKFKSTLVQQMFA